MAVQFVELVCERLSFCAKDMGIPGASPTAPITKIEREDVPYAYTLPGGTLTPTVNADGLVKEYRAFVFRVLLMPFAGGIAEFKAGAQSTILFNRWVNVISFYFLEHQRLATSALPALNCCKQVISISDPGFVIRPAPGGIRFAAIDTTLNLMMEARAAKVAVPYNS